ncbi:cysteine desulfurase family protein [Burkholderia stagnalis]|uniref:cysteine desulfurase family protein n=1 Tax=Burkholderia stagnalis TaxID=1503054 RepID=UPI0007593293|nr:cysteine desulfurase family protein [Burkholderia stagnalis]KVM99983.1 hypothetical protein WT07_00480 [Burkholderia stagnalis]KVN57468.1 hypothetical protein WT14_22605 [Burkholderia stagnalis]KWE01685.1 hypothetical protein WT47_22565 [Burkholderia stagnalis]KWE13578.1 hypothetical protein WT48_20355 [Burkholderia stagnalis]KWO80372.1 hypothetical protein WU00_06510 [Burkholderia stagnalis]
MSRADAARPGAGERFVYLDFNARTPVAPEVIDAMAPYWRDVYGNPSASHRQGRLARDALDGARAAVAALVGVTPEWIVFTSGATEANNLALAGFAWSDAARAGPARRMIVSAVEHPSIQYAAAALRTHGWDVATVPVDGYGTLRIDAFDACLTPQTRLVSLAHANNETGVVQPLGVFAARSRACGARVHTDASQSIGKVPVDVHALGVDMLTLSGHKFYGPPGVGALVRDPALPLVPLLHGVPKEFGLRPGTESVPLIVGLGAAARLADTQLSRRAQAMRSARDRLARALFECVPGLLLNGSPDARLPNTLNVSFPGCNARALLAALDDRLAASAGPARVVGGMAGESAVAAMGGDAARVAGAVRLSVGVETTDDDIDRAVRCLHGAWLDEIGRHAS